MNMKKEKKKHDIIQKAVWKWTLFCPGDLIINANTSWLTEMLSALGEQTNVPKMEQLFGFCNNF